MACLEVVDTVDAGSDITFTVRPDEGGLYPDISDMTCDFKAYFDRALIVDMSIGVPSSNGSTVTLEVDGTSQYLAFYIKGIETVNLSSGNFIFNTTMVSFAYGTRTETKGIFEICKGE